MQAGVPYSLRHQAARGAMQPGVQFEVLYSHAARGAVQRCHAVGGSKQPVVLGGAMQPEVVPEV